MATHANFGTQQEFEGTVSGEVDGKPYLGDFKEAEHDDHGKKKRRAGEPVFGVNSGPAG